MVKGLRGFIQGYNAQAVTNEQQIVLAAEVMTAGGDFGHLEPMLDATRRELHAIGVEKTPGVVVGRRRLLASAPDGARHRPGQPGAHPARHRQTQDAAAGLDGGYYAFMRRVLAGERGGELYGRRQPMIEPVFGQTKHNRGMDRFTDEAEARSGPNGG